MVRSTENPDQSLVQKDHLFLNQNYKVIGDERVKVSAADKVFFLYRVIND